MTSKHTPGPWTVKGKQSIRGPNSEYIDKTNWSNGEADARLIAAAPDLLEALRSTLADLERLATAEARANMAPTGQPRRTVALDKWNAARAAIAKAEGEAP